MARDETQTSFDAFISYSRKDADFARVLETALEKFVAPKGLEFEQRHMRIFRDEGDLTGTDYFDAIDGHLKTASKLIVICSPEARESEFVNDEIRRFVAVRGPQSVIPVLFRGKPNNEVTGADQAQAAFPQALCEALTMPLAIDYLDFDAKSEKPARGRFQNSWYMLLSNIFECSRTDIEQRDLKRQQRNRRITGAIVSAVMASLAALTVFAFLQRNEAIEQRELAVRNEEVALANEALANENERRSTGLLFSSLAREEMGNNRHAVALGWAGAAFFRTPELVQAQSALLKAFYDFASAKTAVWEDIVHIDDSPFSIALSTDRNRIVTGGHDTVGVLDLKSRETRFLPARRVWAIDEAPDGTLAIGTENDGVALIDPESGEVLRKLAGFHASHLSFSPDGSRILAPAWDGTSVSILRADGSGTKTLGFGQSTGYVASGVFSPDGSKALVNRGNGDIRLVDVAAGTQVPLSAQDWVDEAAFFAGGIVAGTRNGLLWRDNDGKETRFFEGESVLRVIARDDGKVFFMGGLNTYLDLNTGKILAEFERNYSDSSFQTGAALSPDGRFAFVQTGQNDIVRGEVWALTNPARQVADLDLGDYGVEVFFSPDSQFLIAFGADGVRRFAVSAGLPEPRISQVPTTRPPEKFETDDGYVVDAESTSDAKVTLPGGGEPLVLRAKAYITAPPVLSKSRRYVLLGTKVADARLYDLSDPSGLPVIYRSKGQEYYADAVAISENDMFVALAGGALDERDKFDSGEIRVYVYAREGNSDPLVSFPLHDTVSLLEFSEGDTYLRVGKVDGTLTEYPLAGPIADWIGTVPEFQWARDAGYQEALSEAGAEAAE